MSSGTGHSLSMSDPDNPLNWSVPRKVYVSFSAFMFAFTVAFGITVYTAGISGVQSQFEVGPIQAVLGFSIMFLGVAFAPLVTPHLSERFGRRPVYWASLPLFALCIMGVALQKTYGGLLALRFLAGFFGGPCLVLIEGTFADLWTATRTVTYYSFLTLASYLGAAFGPVIGGFVFVSKGFQWLGWVTLMAVAATLLLSIGMPETYNREILRRRARRNGSKAPLSPAQSGESFSEMFTVTGLRPLAMIVSDPITILVSLYLGLNFAVVFQWFITVPVALNMAYGFTVQRAGLAFLAAVGGALLAAVTSIILDAVSAGSSGSSGMPSIERRWFPAMFGSVGIFVSLFWIGFTASPKFSFYSPIFGTALYVWGNMSVLVSAVSYLFDAYSPVGTLSALTAAACFRIICAGTVPIGILPMFMNLTGAWALATFGFISLAMVPIPFILYKFGAKLRASSRFEGNEMSTMEAEFMGRHKQGGNGSA